MKALLLKTFVVAALMLAGTGSASAQFGNLMNKAKNAAKKEVKKGFAALDKKINASNVVSGGTLKFVSGSGDGGSSMYGGQNIGLAF